MVNDMKMTIFYSWSGGQGTATYLPETMRQWKNRHGLEMVGGRLEQTVETGRQVVVVVVEMVVVTWKHAASFLYLYLYLSIKKKEKKSENKLHFMHSPSVFSKPPKKKRQLNFLHFMAFIHFPSTIILIK